jgi:1-acyl-sn-glycerol-3-phosphate acyltransferase
MPKRVKILTKIWFGYFLVTITVIGCAFSFLAFFPLVALSNFIPVIGGWPDAVFAFGVGILMRVQPWLKARVRLNVPEGGRVLLVSNHRSHLDVFFLLAWVPGVRILARSTLFRIPGLGLMMRATHQIGVERGRLDAWVGAMKAVAERLRQGEKVHIFPEMTRCPQGFQSVQQFAAAPFLVAIQEDATVVPLVFKNTDGVWPKGEVGLHFRKPVEVMSLPPLRARDFASADSLKSEVWKRIDQALVQT